MKIQRHNYLGLMFDAQIQQQIFDKQKSLMDPRINIIEREVAEKEIQDLLSSDGNKNYLMSGPSIEISSKIRIDEDKIDYKMFCGLPVGKKITILINDSLFYRYLVFPTSVLCIWVKTEDAGNNLTYVTYTTFRINTDNGYLVYPDADKPLQVELFRKFIQYFIFLEFSTLETVTLKPNMKVGTKKQGNYLNGSNQDVVIVDSTWNKIIIRTGDFAVSGHLRLQPIGEGRTLRKLIYIEGFTKNGYVRNAKKETVNQLN
jgi:hypothetical protein